MDEEKINKTIEILLQNQAQFYADLQKIQEVQREMQETQREMQKAQARSESHISTLQDVSLNLLEAVKLTNDGV